MKTALTIAGSDSSGGAGIQADIKTMTANGVFATCAVTALTAQNTTGVTDILESTPHFLAEQLDAVFTDIVPDAVKIGMVSSAELIAVIAEKLRQYGAERVVVDPVMVATSGAKLLRDDAIQALTSQLLPLATVLTPNIPEAEILSGLTITDAAGMEAAARTISQRYGCAVLCKGGHQINDADDLLQETFIKVYINLHRYSTDYTFGQWVYTIARNTFIDFVRRRQDDLSIDERFSSPPSTAPTPEESVISLQQRTQIEHYLERLTPRYRTLIVMRFFDEYSYEEIAAKLTLPLGTVKTQIHRAREQMCKLIAQGDER